MAALCARISGTVARSPLHRSISGFQVISKQSGKPFQQRLTWSQLKHMHNQSESKVAVPLQSKRSRFSRHWLVMMATAGFSQGFLGINLGKKEDEKKGGDPLLRVYAEAKHAHMTQDFNKAEIRYHDALKVADEMLKLKKINFKTYLGARTNIFDSLADMALVRGDLEKAEALYKETMKGCLQQGLEIDSNAIIELSIKLSSIYAMLDRAAEAEQGLQFCIKSQDAKMSAEEKNKAFKVPDIITEAVASQEADPDKLLSEDAATLAQAEQDEEEKKRDTQALLGMALETYGRFLMGQRRLGEAVPLLERALDVAETVLGTDNGQYIILLNDLASAQILMRNWDQATKTLNKAIESATKMKSSQLPALYCNLGAVFLRTSKLDQAKETCLKAQDLANKNKNTTAFSMSQKCLEKIQQVKKGAA
ncbi:tetratricopeptide repeat protein 19, mitochondrial-like isoform X2 [Littorina saxatilis]|uniref:MalT-like TPR region domain-containing protein n=1 Tax=Littorina saxatilis TaxID=31220 RepID=A0AAN9AXM2_9CAEN